jgi:uncharacterized cupredoxin-like copper-binding protein
MKTKATVLAIATFAALGLAAASALAHGDEVHKKAAGAAVKKEQQPWGIAGDAKDATRSIDITMSDDMRFTPSSIEVKEGETIRFVVQNKGQVLHEMVIGTKKALDEHAALMLKFPNMEHDDAHMAHVGAGRKGELVWKFNRPGDFDFACLVPGHYQAGMVGRIKVVQAGQVAQAVATTPAAQAAAPAGEYTEAEVRRVDKSAGKVTLKHGEIKNLDMPPMTMVFGVAKPELLDSIKAGDKVRFRAIAQDGSAVVTEIEPAQ